MITKSDGDKLLSEIARTKPSKPLTIMTKFHVTMTIDVRLLIMKKLSYSTIYHHLIKIAITSSLNLNLFTKH